MAEQKYSLVRARVPKRAHGRGKGVSITVEGGAPVSAPVGDHDKLANVKTLSSFRDGDKAVHLTPKQAKKLLGMMQDVNTAIGAGVSAANDFTNLTASTLTLTGSQQFIASHNSQISQLNKQEDALKDHALLSAELKALMLGFRGKVNAAMTALKALLADKKWDDVAVQEKVTELKTMLGHYAESIALSQKSLTDRVNADAISGLQDILNQANQHANQLSASTLQLANQHTNTALAPINQSIIEQAARLDAMQKQIDGEVSHFNGEYIPTDANYPANEWTTTEAKKRHINDTFTDLRPKSDGTEAGYSWKWVEESPGVFKWVVIADGGEAALLAQIAALQGAVDGKITHYLSKPSAYKKGDFWTLEANFSVSGKVWKKGSIVSAKVDSVSFNWGHWENPRYISLDDIAVGGVNLIRNSKEIALNDAWGSRAFKTPIPAGTEFVVSIGAISSDFNGKICVSLRKTNMQEWAGVDLLFEKGVPRQSKAVKLEYDCGGLWFYSADSHGNSWGHTHNTVYNDVMVEVGNTPSSWSPAPEDVEEFTTLSISTASINTKNTAKASALIDAITKKRKEIEARYLKISPICPEALKAQLLNTFTSYKGAEETLRNACNGFMAGSNQTDAQYLQVIGEATTGGKPHNLYTNALDTYTRIEAEADRGKDGKEVRPNLLEGTNFGKPMVFSMIADPSFAIYSEDMYPCVEVGYGWGFRSKNMTLQPGTYTISCLAKSALDTPSQPRISSTDIFGTKYFELIDNTKWVPLKHSFTLTETKTGIFYFLAENAQGRVKFAQIKLEAGDGSTAYVVHPNDLIPPIKWVGTSLKVNDGAPVQLKGEKGDKPTTQWQGTTLFVDGIGKDLKGEKGDTGEFSPEQSAMLSAHEVSINQHGGQISQLEGNVSAHGNTIGQHGGQISALQGSVNAHGNTLSSHGNSISAHSNQINQQGNTISQHDQTIAEHTQSITELTRNFGMEVPSILISNTQQYIQVLEEIEQQAMAKSGRVCSTIRLTSSNVPIILPCPEKFVDRQVTIARLAEPLNYCALFHDCIYIHTTKSSSSVGVLAGGAMPFNNFVYYSQAPSYAGCMGYRINQNITGLNKFRALSEIDCNQSLSLTFLAVNYSGGYRWLLMDVSAFDAHISPNEAGTIWRAVQQVRGQEPWTIKHNGQIVPASKHSASTFTVTEMMGWIEYNGSGRTTTMDFPTSLSEGFMCYVQNNARQPLTVSGCSPVGTLRDVPARSLCLCRKGTRNNMLIFQISTI